MRAFIVGIDVNAWRRCLENIKSGFIKEEQVKSEEAREDAG